MRATTSVKGHMRKGRRVKAHRRVLPPIKWSNSYCERCGDRLSSAEKRYGENACFPCMKGNREDE